MAKINISVGSATGLLNNFEIYLDGSFIKKMKQNSTIIIEIDSGKHVFQFKDTSWIFKKSKEYEFDVSSDDVKNISINLVGFSYEINISGGTDFGDKMVKNNKELKEIINTIISQKETVELAIKGSFREYLICTDKKVYIIKKGYMTGHFFGNGSFNIPYSRITNVEIDFHLMTGYFEISTGGIENKRLNYWSKNEKVDPVKQPNCIAINSECKNDFEIAKDFIFEKMHDLNNKTIDSTSKSIPEQIREYKQLLDDDIISKEEYDEKKKELLGK